MLSSSLKADTQESRRCEFQSKSKKRQMSQFEGNQTGQISSYLGEGQPFVLFMFSTDWIRPTHIGEDHLFYSVYNSNVSLIQKHSHRCAQNNFEQQKKLCIVWSSQAKTEFTIQIGPRNICCHGIFLL